MGTVPLEEGFEVRTHLFRELVELAARRAVRGAEP
jgi:hypothetical protein